MPPLAAPTTDEMGETRGAAHVEAAGTFWHCESVRRVAWAPVGTPNCCHEHAEQNLCPLGRQLSLSISREVSDGTRL